MTIKNAKAARRVVSARLQTYFTMVKEQLPTRSLEFWELVESPELKGVLVTGG